MELADAKVGALLVSILPEQAHDLPLAGHVGNLLRGCGCGARGLAFSSFAIQTASFHEVLDRFFKRPLTGVKIYIDSDASSSISREPQHLSLRSGIQRVQTSPQQHLFAIKRPAFNEDVVGMLPANFIRQMLCDR